MVSTNVSGEPPWYLYIVLTVEGALYTGITTDVERRFQEHCDMYRGVPGARGAKYFRSHQPAEVVYQETLPDRATAARREHAVKALSRARKMALIRGLGLE